MSKKRNILLMLAAACTFIVVIVCIFIVFNCHVQTIYLGIAEKSTLRNVRSMITVLLIKLLCSTILIVSGIYCIYLYYQSLKSSCYIALTTAFFLAAGVIMTLMDYKVVFYAALQSRRVWQHCGDIFLLLLSCILQRLLFRDYNEKKYSTLRWCYFIFHGVLAVAMLLSSPVDSRELLCIYGYIVWILAVLQFVRIANNPFSAFRLCRLFMMLALDAYIMLVGANKFNTTSPLYTFYLDDSPYFLVIYMQLAFALIFRYQRKCMVLPRGELHRIQDVQNYMQALTSNTISNAHNLLDELSRQAYEAAASPSGIKSVYALGEALENAAKKTKDSLNLLHFYRLPEQLDLSQVNLDIIFRYVERYLKKSGAADSTLITHFPEGYDVYCDPSLIVRACCTLAQRLRDLSENGRLYAVAQPGADQLILRLSTVIRPECNKQARMLRYFLEHFSTDFQDATDDELSLLIAKRIITAHGAKITVRRQAKTLIVCWPLQLWNSQSNSFVSSSAKDTSIHAIHVALLSTSSMQTRLIASSLNDSFFCLHAFTSHESLLKYLQVHRINVVIVGTLSVKATAMVACSAIRRNYSMGTLPIILLQSNDAFSLDSSFVQMVNDILREPFSHTELNRRIFSLCMLQRSTLELQRARLDFLQSQMNPHFIFNAISAIMPLCISDPQKAYRLLGFFSEYLRGNLFPSKSNRPVPLCEEVDLIRAYLALENARMQDRITCDIVEAYDEDATILPLLIEPLVENCVKHGMRKDIPGAQLHIDVEIRQENENLFISVHDDGVGFDLAAMQADISKKEDRHRSIGLANLNDRLKLYYGASLHIDSAVNQGATVSFCISKTIASHVQEAENPDYTSRTSL